MGREVGVALKEVQCAFQTLSQINYPWQDCLFMTQMRAVLMVASNEMYAYPRCGESNSLGLIGVTCGAPE